MPDPVPNNGEVLVRIAASGVNPSDWKTRGGPRPMAGPRVIPHSDGAGVINAVGSGVDPARIGERVWIWNAQWQRAHGTAAEYVALPAAQAVTLDAGTSFEEGACLGIPALTAYRSESVVERVRAETDGYGVDLLVEVDAAGSAPLLPQVLARDGVCTVYGSSAPEIRYGFGPMITSGANLRFFIVYELAPSVRKEAQQQLGVWLSKGLARHALAQRFALAEIVLAHEAVERGALIDNVVVTP